MKITFLGTSAANAYPEAFCSCSNCVEARKLGGPSLRKRAALLVNQDLLIDLGPDIHTAAQTHQISLTSIRYCLQTHHHADHLDLSHLLSRSPAYGVQGAPLFHFYASPETLQIAAETFRRDLADFDLFSMEGQETLNLKIHPTPPLRRFRCGRYQIIAFPANHAFGTGAYLYAVSQGDHGIFYGCDTASLSEEVWAAFHSFGLKFDIVILDHTYGPEEVESDHLNANGVIHHIRRMRTEGILKPNGSAYATHIAHEGNPPFPQLSAFAQQNGYHIAYDGLAIKL